MPLTPAKPPLWATKSARDRAGQLSEQSESDETSVIMREVDRSIDKMVARKLPFSVLTVAVVRPAPGEPWITGSEEAVGLGVRRGVGVGVEVGVGEGVTVIMGVGGGVG